MSDATPPPHMLFIDEDDDYIRVAILHDSVKACITKTINVLVGHYLATMFHSHIVD